MDIKEDMASFTKELLKDKSKVIAFLSKAGIVDENGKLSKNYQTSDRERKEDLVFSLKKLSKDMKDIAVKMDYYGGFSDMTSHGRELLNAAFMVDGWVEGVMELLDAEEGDTPCKND